MAFSFSVSPPHAKCVCAFCQTNWELKEQPVWQEESERAQLTRFRQVQQAGKCEKSCTQ